MQYALGLYEKAMPANLGWEEMLLSAKEAGFDHLEISIDEGDARLARLQWSARQREDLCGLMYKTGMPIKTMCLSGHRKYPLGSHDPATRARSMDIMRSALDLASDLGIRIVQLAGYDVYYEESDAESLALFAENLKKSVEYAAMKGVVMGFETMETPFMDTITKGMAYVEQLNSPYLGMYPDLGNLTNAIHAYGLDMAAEIQAGRGHCFAMHLKETEEGKYRDMDFGTGRVDFVSGIRQAQACGIHLFVAEFWHDGRAEWKKRLRASCNFLRDRFAAAR